MSFMVTSSTVVESTSKEEELLVLPVCLAETLTVALPSSSLVFIQNETILKSSTLSSLASNTKEGSVITVSYAAPRALSISRVLAPSSAPGRSAAVFKASSIMLWYFPPILLVHASAGVTIRLAITSSSEFMLTAEGL